MDTGTSIFLVGLFLVALGLSVAAFALKYKVLSVSSGMAWIVIAIIIFTTPTLKAYTGLWMLCTLLAVVMVTSVMYLNKKPVILPPPPVSNSDQILANAERVRKLRGQHRMKDQKGIF